ncbi:hypothetical protein Pmani_022098 [Petrolisthes manimaculis]|uniref:Uncharacterized protein n=1 Tax=Petrolisthes manimaculis TaxID=1843537 RepID=A0AAE1PF28_9EUCA|nr:hypothetical protein Pmani_022098 [Petrolisthes manimaculis]
MGEKYLFGQLGMVEEVIYPGKAILTFQLCGQTQRVLLWVKCFVHQGKMLERTDSFLGKLNIGDRLNIDCHTYDKESFDNCQWYAARASKEVLEDLSQSNKPHTSRVANQYGHISEVEPGKGVIVFNFCNEEQRVFFMRSKVFLFGKRPKRSLREFLSENNPLQFDAEMCSPTSENYHCNWFATVVWKGKKPLGVGTSVSLTSGASVTADDVTADDSASNAGDIGRGDVPGVDEFPGLGLPPGLSERQGYKAFEANGPVRQGWGNVLALFSEECGLALWMVSPNTWETVFFHRSNTTLDSVPLTQFDLQESLAEGTSLEISAVPAVSGFPCRWIAKKAVVQC